MTSRNHVGAFKTTITTKLKSAKNAESVRYWRLANRQPREIHRLLNLGKPHLRQDSRWRPAISADSGLKHSNIIRIASRRTERRFARSTKTRHRYWQQT